MAPAGSIHVIWHDFVGTYRYWAPKYESRPTDRNSRYIWIPIFRFGQKLKLVFRSPQTLALSKFTIELYWFSATGKSMYRPGLGKYWKLNRSSRWRHYLTNFHRKKNWYLSRKLMTINEVLWINPDFRTMVVRYCVWWPEFLVSNILRCSATHVKANTRLERVRR